jgi:hypothetical protein
MKKTLFAVGLGYIFLILLFIVIFNSLQQDMNSLPKGELVEEVPSPSKQSAIRMYLVSEGGATSRHQMRGEVVYENRERKNIYFNYDEERTNVDWINEETVSINGERINIEEDVYFWKDDPKWEEKREKKYE